MRNGSLAHLQRYLNLGLTPIPLKPHSKEPLVKWRNGWNPTLEDLKVWASDSVNWGVSCGKSLAVVGLDSEDAHCCFVREHSFFLARSTVKKPISPTLPQPCSHDSTEGSIPVQLNACERATVQFQSWSNRVERTSCIQRDRRGYWHGY